MFHTINYKIQLFLGDANLTLVLRKHEILHPCVNIHTTDIAVYTDIHFFSSKTMQLLFSLGPRNAISDSSQKKK